MWNTCSIGRRWKPREGWSRPVLTGERGTLFPTRLLGRVSSCGGFSLDGKEHCFLVVTMTIPVKRLVVRVRCPVPGPPRSESWHGSGSAGRPVGVGRCIGFAVVMAQVRRPVPFRTRKLRPGRGDGTALERVWESSTPPHSTYGPSGRVPYGIPGRSFSYSPRGSRRAFRSGNPIFVSERVFSSAHWRFLDAGRPVGGRIAPVSGWIWMLVNLPTYQFLQ